MKKVLSASVLSLVLFGSVSLSGIEKGFEVRDVLEDRITNEATGRRVTPRRAGEEVTPDVSDDIKVQARYDSETGTYDFRFVAGINTVDVDKASVTVTMGGKQASVSVNKAYERIQNGNATQTAAEVFGEGYNYLVAYALTDVPSSQVGASFNVKVGLVASETEVSSFAEDVTLSDVVNADVNELAIQFDNTDPLQVVAGSEVTLPNYTITDGALTGAEVRITAENGVVANGTYTPDRYSDKGTHTLTYTAVQPHTGLEKVLGTLNVEVAPKILAGKTVPAVKVENEFSNPVLITNDGGISGASFNFEPGKYYYAEFTMAKISGYDDGQVIGFSHNLHVNGDPTQGLYWNGFKLSASDAPYPVEIAFSNYVSSWNLNRIWRYPEYANNRGDNLNIDIANKDTKVAIARDNDKFYTFINDKLFNVSVYPELQNKDTYPGLIMDGISTTSDIPVQTSFSNFAFIRNVEDIQDKISTLVGLNTFDYYGVYGESITANHADFNLENGFTYKDSAATCNDMNSTIVEPYVALYGNWEVSFVANTTLLGDSNNWGAFRVAVRSLENNNREIFTWRLRCNSTQVSSEQDFTKDGNITLSNPSTYDELGNISRENIGINIKCTVGSGTETYTITVTPNNGTPVTFEQVATYSSGTVGAPKHIFFHSQKWCGTVSNFTYSTQAA